MAALLHYNTSAVRVGITHPPCREGNFLSQKGLFFLWHCTIYFFWFGRAIAAHRFRGVGCRERGRLTRPAERGNFYHYNFFLERKFAFKLQ